MGMDRKIVREIARNYLQQTHEVRNIRVVRSKDGVWLAKADVHSSSGDCVRKLKVSDETGIILSVE